ncbi:hypothetical protein GGR56DRAFT_343865 [Xylariaceae sp. FL0804]|nr:hypothetical protein GGR56DRAFT_343865 [Xylariaceae sp. FL0804]
MIGLRSYPLIAVISASLRLLRRTAPDTDPVSNSRDSKDPDSSRTTRPQTIRLPTEIKAVYSGKARVRRQLQHHTHDSYRVRQCCVRVALLHTTVPAVLSSSAVSLHFMTMQVLRGLCPDSPSSVARPASRGEGAVVPATPPALRMRRCIATRGK